jgi:hypothetical protein
MKDRTSAPSFHWNSNVSTSGRSEYTGFGRDPLATPDGRSTFVGNNRRLTDDSGRPSFVGNNRNLTDPDQRREFVDNYKVFGKTLPPQDNSAGEVTAPDNSVPNDEAQGQRFPAEETSLEEQRFAPGEANSSSTPRAPVPVDKPAESGF